MHEVIKEIGIAFSVFLLLCAGLVTMFAGLAKLMDKAGTTDAERTYRRKNRLDA